ncbi:hypothetical protein Cni_G28811 [Canna indica]|uniref:Retrotransposon gag domain-containing protein n=1 Tax=Canna indica TaxID=4628 RepID=A0AAQ3QQL5_9LILI|nr:hypothetical protein Cni_G28811 [Canna indica]
MDALVERIRTLEATIGPMVTEMADLRAELVVQRRTLSATEPRDSKTRLKVPEPRCFNGDRSSKELENFIWDMEHYFGAARVAEEEKVALATMYLAGDAKLWWWTRDSIVGGRPKIEDWDALKKELRQQFLPSNTSWVAREALCQLCKLVRGPHRAFECPKRGQLTALLRQEEDSSEEDGLPHMAPL